MSPEVSVIIPSFNHAKYVGEAISSALEQDFRDFEVIVSDDASTDDSWEVIDSFSDSRVKKIRREANVGVVSNYNDALELSRGNIIMTIGSDDRLLPGAIGAHVAFLRVATKN